MYTFQLKLYRQTKNMSKGKVVSVSPSSLLIAVAVCHANALKLFDFSLTNNVLS